MLNLNVNDNLTTYTFKVYCLFLILGCGYFSIRVLNKLGFVPHFGNNRVMIFKHGDLADTRTLSSTNIQVVGLYKSPVQAERTLKSSPKLWYQRLVHVNPSAIKQIVANNVVKGVQITLG